MNVLVTGANGFIGRHLCAILAQAGCRVTALARSASQPLLSGIDDPAAVLRRIRHVIIPDLSPETDFRSLLSGQQAVVHLAGRAHVLHDDAADPKREFHRINVELTERLAVDSLASNVKKFVYISSIGVLGNHTNGVPFDRHSAETPVEAYAESKLRAEKRLQSLFQGRDSLTIIRPPLVYGAGAKGNFERLMKLIDRLPILPFGAVTARRSYVHVRNLCSFIDTCLRSESHNGVFVVCDGEDLPLNELCRILADEMHKKRWLVPLPVSILKTLSSILGKRTEIDRLTSDLVIDNQEEKQLTGWEPPFAPRDGIREMVRGFLKKAA